MIKEYRKSVLGGKDCLRDQGEDGGVILRWIGMGYFIDKLNGCWPFREVFALCS